MAAINASPIGITVTASATPGFGSALRSEWTKLRSLRSTWIMFSLAIGLSIGFSTVTSIIAGMTYDNMSDGLQAEFDPILTTMSGWLFGMILVTVLAVTAVTSEYSSGMIRTTLINNPRRLQVFAAKAIVVGLMGMTITTIIVPGMFLVSQPIYSSYGLETASLGSSDTIRFLLLGSFLMGPMHALIPFSFAWLLRGPASGITVALGFAVLPWMLTTLVPQWVKENIFRYLPDTAKDSLLGQLEPGATLYLSDRPAAIVIAIWVFGLLTIAAYAFNRRDV